MRIVLDTNVLIAAFISHGACHELLEHISIEHEMILSDVILDEFSEKLSSKFKFDDDTIHSAMQLLRSRASVVDLPQKIDLLCRDADDDFVIATALEGRCDMVISGDKDLTDLKSIKNIPIIRPSDFWKFEAAPPSHSGEID